MSGWIYKDRLNGTIELRCLYAEDSCCIPWYQRFFSCHGTVPRYKIVSGLEPYISVTSCAAALLCCYAVRTFTGQARALLDVARRLLELLKTNCLADIALILSYVGNVPLNTICETCETINRRSIRDTQGYYMRCYARSERVTSLLP